MLTRTQFYLALFQQPWRWMPRLWSKRFWQKQRKLFVAQGILSHRIAWISMTISCRNTHLGGLSETSCFKIWWGWRPVWRGWQDGSQIPSLSVYCMSNQDKFKVLLLLPGSLDLRLRIQWRDLPRWCTSWTLCQIFWTGPFNRKGNHWTCCFHQEPALVRLLVLGLWFIPLVWAKAAHAGSFWKPPCSCNCQMMNFWLWLTLCKRCFAWKQCMTPVRQRRSSSWKVWVWRPKWLRDPDQTPLWLPVNGQSCCSPRTWISRPSLTSALQSTTGDVPIQLPFHHKRNHSWNCILTRPLNLWLCLNIIGKTLRLLSLQCLWRCGPTQTFLLT